MSNNEVPAGNTGGSKAVPVTDDLPEKMRVHALAKLIGRTSKDVLAALGELGIDVKGAQSSVDRKVAEQVVTALVPVPAEESAPPAAPAPAAPSPVAEPAAEAVEPAVESLVLEQPVVEKRKAAPAMAPVFAPPAPLFQPPTRPTRSRRQAVETFEEPADASSAEDATTGSVPEQDEAPAPRRRSRARRTAEPKVEIDDEAGTTIAEDVETVEDESDRADERADDGADDPVDDGTDDDGEGSNRRRRRRGRRGRGRGRGGDESMDDSDDDTEDDSDESDSEESESTDESGDEPDDADDSDETDEAGEGGTRRRRRRRRRKGSVDESASDDDPPGTITRVRAPREARDADDDGVQSVRGSTRLEAKRQRRRDGRDAGRRRAPILSEAEFLARRESVDRAMVVRERGGRVEIGVLEDGVLVEHFVAGAGENGNAVPGGPSMVGNIYLGRVQNVLPSMEAAFVDIGRGRNAVLYAGEVDWDAAGLNGKARRIEQALSSGDSVLVQVTKDPVGHKGARLTTQISLAGRFLVYVPSGGAAGISRKLPDVERKRLKDMLKEIVPHEAGVIIRTASEGVSHEALERDVRRLQAQWEVVKTRSEQTGPNKPKAPVLLYEEPDLIVKVVRDQFNEDFTQLVVEGEDAWETVSNYIGHVAPELSGRLHRHVGTKDVFAEYRIDEQLMKALDRKVWLPSGGTLVIDRTEAMTVVDVNTGKYTGSGGNLEETVTRNNLEAAEEIVRQLRLRDVGGIIVIDFIDMVLEANRDLVLRRLTECLARDRTRHQVAEVTSLGLVQMTRKRVGGGLLEHFSHPCEHCRGRGIIVSAEPVVEKSDERQAQRPAEREGRRARGRGRRDGENGNGSSTAHLAEQVTDDRSGLAAVAAASAVVEERAAPGPAPAAAAAANGHVVDELVAEAPVELPVESPAQSIVEPAAETNGHAEPAESLAPSGRPRRRGRVTRTAGAPSVAEAEVPAVEQVAEPVTEPVAGPSVAETNGHAEPAEPLAPSGRTRRRGRVTRTAGAPSATEGEAPAVAVVTVPVRAEESIPETVAPAVSSQPEPSQQVSSQQVSSQPEPSAVVSRPRRRAASRPAGPPADAVEAAPSTGGGDPA